MKHLRYLVSVIDRWIVVLAMAIWGVSLFLVLLIMTKDALKPLADPTVLILLVEICAIPFAFFIVHRLEKRTQIELRGIRQRSRALKTRVLKKEQEQPYPWYEILGVFPDATIREIGRAYDHSIHVLQSSISISDEIKRTLFEVKTEAYDAAIEIHIKSSSHITPPFS